MKANTLIELDRGLARDIISWADDRGKGVRQIVPMRGLEVREKRGGARLVQIENQPFVHNDGIIIIDIEEGRAVLPRFGTVDPGWYYTANPMRPGGCAHLANGIYDYRPGPHTGRPAFRQAGPVKIFRDRNKNGIIDRAEELVPQTGRFGIHIHAGGIYLTYKGRRYPIGKWSAGCCAVAGVGGWLSAEWIEFRDLLYEVYAESNDAFSVHVCDFSDVFDAPRRSPATTSIYKIQRGDTLWLLARRFTGGDVGSLLKLNEQIINPDLIRENDKIIVPARSLAA